MIRRVLIAGGGTGGHLFPGIAVVEELRRRNPSLEVLYVGTERGIEARVIPERGERLELLDVAPLKGRSVVQRLRSLVRLPRALWRSARILGDFKPDLVVGVGGFAAGPVVLAAVLRGIPAALLEQNAHVGLTNRILAPLVGRAYLSFESTMDRFPAASARLVGNPVRQDFVRIAKQAISDPEGFEARARHILVMGGSLGSRALNELVPEALSTAGVANSPYKVVHQAGTTMRDAVEARYRELGVEAEVRPFIEDMGRMYANAALVVCRAGATTVAEICAVGRPSILIPYPYAADDHQYVNGKVLEDGGASHCIRESDATVEGVGATIAAILSDSGLRQRMSEEARRLGKPDAAASIVDDLFAWLGGPPSATWDVEESDHELDAEESLDSGLTSESDSENPPSLLRGRRSYQPRRRSRRGVASRSGAGARRPLVARGTVLD